MKQVAWIGPLSMEDGAFGPFDAWTLTTGSSRSLLWANISFEKIRRQMQKRLCPMHSSLGLFCGRFHEVDQMDFIGLRIAKWDETLDGCTSTGVRVREESRWSSSWLQNVCGIEVLNPSPW